MIGWRISLVVFTVTVGAALQASGCSSGNGSGSSSTMDADAASSSCAEDASLLAPDDAAADPSGAACQECLASPSSVVAPDGETCLSVLEACNADCVCLTAVTTINACIKAGGSPTTCFVSAEITSQALSHDVPFGQLTTCQSVACAAACAGATTTDGSAGSTESDGSDAGATAPADAGGSD